MSTLVVIAYTLFMFSLGPIGWGIWFFTGGPTMLQAIFK